MPNSVLTRGRKFVARLTALAMVASIMVIGAAPASAAIDTSATCPSSTPSAGFVDIAAYSASTQLAINCLVDYGISKGTSATTYSPAQEVSRWQMALFLTRQAEVHGLTLGSGADQGFTDIGAYPAATQTAINQLAQLDITQGTTATTYSPADPVSRWQMALFLTRLLDAAGYTLGSGSSQGFTDIAAYPASTQTAINQIAQADVSEGFTATTFGPGQNTLRSQMALFLTRTLAADGITPTVVSGLYVTSPDTANDRYTVADPGTCSTSTVSYAATGTTFSVNGSSTTKTVFETALDGSGVKTVTSTATHHSLTTGVVVGSGLVGTADFATGFTIVEPVTGQTLRTVTYNQAFDSYSVGGTGASLGGFNANVSVGDTVVITGGNGTTSAQARTIALTNGTVTGTADGAATANVFSVSTSCATLTIETGDPTTDTHTYTVGGSVSNQTAYTTAVSSNDQVTYARASGTSTWTLTNQAPASSTGKVYAFDGTGDTVSIAVSSTSEMDVNYGTVATLRVNGAIATSTEFEAALTLGDNIVYQGDNPDTSADESALNLTDAAFSGAPATLASDLIALKINGQTSTGVDINDQNPAGVTGGATVATPVYTVNGSTVTEPQFEASVANEIAFNRGSVTTSVNTSTGVRTWALTTG